MSTFPKAESEIERLAAEYIKLVDFEHRCDVASLCAEPGTEEARRYRILGDMMNKSSDRRDTIVDYVATLEPVTAREAMFVAFLGAQTLDLAFDQMRDGDVADRTKRDAQCAQDMFWSVVRALQRVAGQRLADWGIPESGWITPSWADKVAEAEQLIAQNPTGEGPQCRPPWEWEPKENAFDAAKAIAKSS